MTVRSFLRDPVRPVVFVPVYFGYERIVEANTYISELSGAPKKKESWLDLLTSLRGAARALRHGARQRRRADPAQRPARTRTCPSWREQHFDDDTRLPAVNALVGDLALSIMRGINAAAAVTPINLLATLLAGDAARRLARERAAAPARAVPEAAARLALQPARHGHRRHRRPKSSMYGESLKIISRVPHKLGDIVKMSDESAQLIAYYRNNVLHLFALPSLVACAFIGNSMLRTEDIQRLAWRIYPYVASELFLRWREEELATVVDGVLAALAELGVLQPNEDRSVWMRPPPDSPRRPAAVDARAGHHPDHRALLPRDLAAAQGGQRRHQPEGARAAVPAGGPAHEHAVRLQLAGILRSRPVREFHRPAARTRRAPKAGEGGNLEFDEVLVRVAADAQLVLSEQIRHSILQVTQV